MKLAMSRLGLKPPARRWIQVEDNPPAADTLATFGLIGMICTWMEADIIEATVKNALAQGCERVLLIDNDSPDDTVERACAAGAELALSFKTQGFPETQRIELMNETVQKVSMEDGREHIWWLWLDADEFVHGPNGQTVAQYLAGLDRRFRIVGSRYFNHYPTAAPASVPGFHPLDLQPMCEETAGQNCAATHRKHHLQRFDRNGSPIVSMSGFHTAESGSALIEPSTHCYTHHFPYRDEAATRARLDALCGGNGAGSARVQSHDADERRVAGHLSDSSRRHLTLDNVYAQRWDQVDRLGRVGKRLGVRPQPWVTVVGPSDADSARWYRPDELSAAIAGEQGS